MKLYEYLKSNKQLLINLNNVVYKEDDLYNMKVYEIFCDTLKSHNSVKATLITMQQQGYGSISTIKRIRRRMESEV